MAIYKCKMCGGDLEVAEGAAVVECDYCGTKQTVPTSNDEELRSLFNRATLLRRKCEFDKAEQIYEKILLKDERQPEAYWGVLLCRYGIEYVEDPKTDKRVPTCHRASFEAITSDEYYRSALEYADPVQRSIYEAEAKYIDGVQKEILALSQKEEPYDVFICYKETDENGKRTEDSAIANDIYYQLTQAGYKVFYAAITLEDKLGSAYEPIIFAALHSSKVMLAIGTKPEYFNAVWVKNEWSRYLKLMKTDKTKQLIPCYRGMDAYELPEEFAHLQAQDMGKIGFITDLVRGIKKVISKEEPKTESRTSDMGASASLKNLMKRAYLDLESKNFQSAQVQFDKMQDVDPENGEVYLIGLLCDLHLSRFEELEECTANFSSNANLMKARRFADPALKARLDKMQELNQKYRKYCFVKSSLGALDDDEVYKKVQTALQELGDYRDGATLSEELFTYRDDIFVGKLEEIRDKSYWEIARDCAAAEGLIAKITDADIRERETAAWAEKLQEAKTRCEEQRQEEAKRKARRDLQDKLHNCKNTIESLDAAISEKKEKIEALNQESAKASEECTAKLTKIKKARIGAILHAVGFVLFITSFILFATQTFAQGDTPDMTPIAIVGIVMVYPSLALLIVGMVFMTKYDMKSTPSVAKIIGFVVMIIFYDIIGIVMLVRTIKNAGKHAPDRVRKECEDIKADHDAQICELEEQISEKEAKLEEVREEYARICSELGYECTATSDNVPSDLNLEEN